MYRIGIDLGGTNISAGLVGDGGKLLFKSSMPTELGGSDVEITELMANFCLQIAKRCDISERDIDSIGIGCPGVCDDENGILLYTVNLPFRNTNIAKIFPNLSAHQCISRTMPTARHLEKLLQVVQRGIKVQSP